MRGPCISCRERGYNLYPVRQRSEVLNTAYSHIWLLVQNITLLFLPLSLSSGSRMTLKLICLFEAHAGAFAVLGLPCVFWHFRIDWLICSSRCNSVKILYHEPERRKWEKNYQPLAMLRTAQLLCSVFNLTADMCKLLPLHCIACRPALIYFSLTFLL